MLYKNVKIIILFFFDLLTSTLENIIIFLLYIIFLEFRIKLKRIGRLYHIAAIKAIG